MNQYEYLTVSTRHHKHEVKLWDTGIIAVYDESSSPPLNFIIKEDYSDSFTIETKKKDSIIDTNVLLKFGSSAIHDGKSKCIFAVGEVPFFVNGRDVKFKDIIDGYNIYIYMKNLMIKLIGGEK